MSLHLAAAYVREAELDQGSQEWALIRFKHLV
jgi:hypothetical protein